MKTVDVNLAERSYQIHIGSGLVPRAADFIAPLLKRHRVAIVTDENVAALHLDTLVAGFKAAGISTASLTLPARRRYCGAVSDLCKCRPRFWRKWIVRLAVKQV